MVDHHLVPCLIPHHVLLVGEHSVSGFCVGVRSGNGALVQLASL
jgi:hypothetical protein